MLVLLWSCKMVQISFVFPYNICSKLTFHGCICNNSVDMSPRNVKQAICYLITNLVDLLIVRFLAKKTKLGTNLTIADNEIECEPCDYPTQPMDERLLLRFILGLEENNSAVVQSHKEAVARHGGGIGLQLHRVGLFDGSDIE